MIPKILHFVWVGSEKGHFPLPHFAVRNLALWRKAQPDYEIALWDDDHLPALDAEQQWAFQHGRNSGETSDVIRHNVLHEFGGYSLDLDIVPTGGMRRVEERLTPETAAVILDDGSRFVGSVPGSALLTEMRRRLPLCLAYAHEHHRDLRCAFTGWRLIGECVRDGIGAADTLTLPGALFPMPHEDTSHAVGIHDFRGDWVKQIA